ncbi:MAG: class I SAM-dependent methyltransferase [Bacteroidia bacterium]|jgi:SAM-dependent methyltransferase|nr:class I SAM-dependent methyltransferase [Bacteroidia bacterium]
MDKAYYKAYYQLERSHWWFTARLHILRSFVSRHFATEAKPLAILNAGVATGATSLMLKEFGTVTSVEYDEDCCAFLRENVLPDVVQASLTALPFADASFDLVCAYDVIEHIEDDVQALREIKRVLKPGGHFHLTVPAFQLLWSNHDVVNHHYRRYRRGQLQQRIQQAGLQTGYASYFNAFLFFPVAAVRLMARLWQKLSGKKQEASLQSDFDTYKTGGLGGKLFYRIFKSETALLRSKVKLPVGISLMATGRKHV